ncbi:MAG: hypothetical protein ACL93V_11175 [Candidatus Electrothrix sp. YB6]
MAAATLAAMSVVAEASAAVVPVEGEADAAVVVVAESVEHRKAKIKEEP